MLCNGACSPAGLVLLSLGALPCHENVLRLTARWRRRDHMERSCIIPAEAILDQPAPDQLSV